MRLPLAVYDQLQAVARQRGMGHTQLMLQYIEAGLAAESQAQGAMIPLAELQQVIAQIAVRKTPAA